VSCLRPNLLQYGDRRSTLRVVKAPRREHNGKDRSGTFSSEGRDYKPPLLSTDSTHMKCYNFWKEVPAKGKSVPSDNEKDLKRDVSIDRGFALRGP